MSKKEEVKSCKCGQVLVDALRSCIDLSHRMAIELDASVNHPRIEYWARKIESTASQVLETAQLATRCSRNRTR